MKGYFELEQKRFEIEEDIKNKQKQLKKLEKDMKSTKKLIRQDDDIDILREYIRDRSIELMALKQPLARDLRYIYSLSDISTELERIGDYATNICKESLDIGEEPFINRTNRRKQNIWMIRMRGRSFIWRTLSKNSISEQKMLA